MTPSPASEPASTRLHSVGDHLVVLHSELAAFYAITPGQLLEISRSFPADFCFNLETETTDSAPDGGEHPWETRVFTEHGALLAGCLLNTPTTLARAVQLTRTCVSLRRQDRTRHTLALAG